jgi:carotenoid cleavage dioxygenase-like enzyme
VKFLHHLKPWLIGWQGTNQETLQTKELEVKGKIPQDLNGSFYRNGPAQNEVKRCLPPTKQTNAYLMAIN